MGLKVKDLPQYTRKRIAVGGVLELKCAPAGLPRPQSPYLLGWPSMQIYGTHLQQGA